METGKINLSEQGMLIFIGDAVSSAAKLCQKEY